MLIGPPVPEIQLFKKLTLKIQGQGHGWGQIQSHNMSLTSYQLTLWFHDNQPCHSWDTTFSKFDLENPGSRSNDHDVAQLQVKTIPSNGINPSSGFRYMGLAKSGPSAAWFDKLGQVTMTLHNYRSRQVHETLNGGNPSSTFRDMRFAKFGPNLWQIWQVFGPWASPYGENGHMTMTVHNYRPGQFHRMSSRENPSSGYRYMGSASLAAAQPSTAGSAARTMITITLQPRGLRGDKDSLSTYRYSFYKEKTFTIIFSL